MAARLEEHPGPAQLEEDPGPARPEKDPVAAQSGEKLVASLIEQNRSRGANPDGWTAGVRWKREADIPDRIYFRALEAMQEAGP